MVKTGNGNTACDNLTYSVVWTDNIGTYALGTTPGTYSSATRTFTFNDTSTAKNGQTAQATITVKKPDGTAYSGVTVLTKTWIITFATNVCIPPATYTPAPALTKYAYQNASAATEWTVPAGTNLVSGCTYTYVAIIDTNATGSI